MNRIGVIVVVFVLGTAFGYLGARSSLGEEPDDRLAPGGEKAEAVSAVNREVVAPLGTAAPRRSVVAEAEPARVAVAPEEGKPVDDAPVTRGTGVVTGSVKTKDGVGVADVVIRLDANSRGSGRHRSVWTTAPPTPESPEEAAAEATRRVRRETAARLETTTDAAGNFRVEGLVDGCLYYTKAWKQGCEITPLDAARAANVKDGDRVEFKAAETYEVFLRVVGGDGAEVESGWLAIWRESSCTGSDWRRGDVLELVAGTIEFELTVAEFNRGKAKVVLPPPTRERLTVEIRLVIPTIVRGKVSCSDPQQVDRIDIHAFAGVIDGVITGDRARAAAASTMAWKSQPSYEITTLKPGTYTFCAMRNEKVLLVTTREISAGVTNLDLEIPAESAADFVIVHAFDPAGASTKVFIEDCINGARAAERSSGDYWLPRSNPERGHPQRAAKSLLVADSDVYGCIALEYSPEKDAEVTVRFEAATTLAVKLEGYKGTAADNNVEIALFPHIETKLELSRAPTSRSSRDERLREIDPAGVWTLKALQPGRYELEVRMSSGAMRGRRLAAKTVVLAAGTNACTVVLPELGRLVVATTLPTPGFRLILDNESPNEKERLSVSPSERRTAEGRYVFDAIPVGTYRLYGYEGKTRYKGRQVLVKGETSVVFEPEPE